MKKRIALMLALAPLAAIGADESSSIPGSGPEQPLAAKAVAPVPPAMPAATSGVVKPANEPPAPPRAIPVATVPLEMVPPQPPKPMRKAGPPNETAMANQYYAGPNPTFSPKENAALAIGRRWRSGTLKGVPPAVGAGGAVQYVFGSSQPTVVCAVMQVCDVELQPGEQVNGIHLGDTVRWGVEPAVTGSGPNEIQHLVIKPLDVNLETSLMVPTNRRTYHMLLRSHRTEFMPRVTFSYPENAAAKWEALKKRETDERRDATLPATGEYLGDLSFDYRVEGVVAWKPVRVYNDGRKTIIQMPGSMAQTEAPSLLVIRKDGGTFSDEETQMVNYRLQGDRFIVDSVFDKAILVAGVGSSQDRVTITKGK